MLSHAYQQVSNISSKLTTAVLCLSLTLLHAPALALLNNGAPSKVAVSTSANIRNATFEEDHLDRPSTEQTELTITSAPTTELLFEVERVLPVATRPPVEESNNTIHLIGSTAREQQNSFEIEARSNTIPVTDATTPRAHRRATPSKIAVATETTTFEALARSEALIMALPTPAPSFSEQEQITVQVNVAPEILESNNLDAFLNNNIVNTESQNITRRPTPSKIAVHANMAAPVATTPISSIEATRDPSTHFYLSAPSKTPVAALEILNSRSSQLPLELSASSVLVIDQNSREILYSRNPLDSMPIASITKLMTAMVVLDAKQNLNQKITITSADIDTLKNTSSRLTVGTRLSRRDLLHLTLMSSENRAAHALSRNYPGGKKAFLAAMNAKARQLGMTQTYYADPTGLSDQNRSSATDLVWLVDAAYKYDLIRNLSTSNKHKVTAGRARLNYTTSNLLVEEKSWHIGLQKTGYIREAGYCLVMQTEISGKSLIMVLLDSDAKKNRIDDANTIRRWISA